jgi:hypothetical protein
MPKSCPIVARTVEPFKVLSIGRTEDDVIDDPPSGRLDMLDVA